ncbi:hypothetical protein QTP88_007739 [Uroleucon formosanum]
MHSKHTLKMKPSFYHQLRYIRSIPEGSSDNTEPTTLSQLPVESNSDRHKQNFSAYSAIFGTN